MPRKNRRGADRRAASRREAVGIKIVKPYRVSPEDAAIPVGRCPLRHRKVMFANEDQAAKALRHAQARRASVGSKDQECRYYLCPACDHYHLASRKTYTPRSAE